MKSSVENCSYLSSTQPTGRRNRQPNCKSLLRVVATVAMAFGVGSCALTHGDEGRYKFSDGWREGTVVEAGPASTLRRPLSPECKALGTRMGEDSNHVSVEYRRMGRRSVRTLPVAPNIRVKSGDLVYVNIRMRCETALPIR